MEIVGIVLIVMSALAVLYAAIFRAQIALSRLFTMGAIGLASGATLTLGPRITGLRVTGVAEIEAAAQVAEQKSEELRALIEKSEQLSTDLSAAFASISQIREKTEVASAELSATSEAAQNAVNDASTALSKAQRAHNRADAVMAELSAKIRAADAKLVSLGDLTNQLEADSTRQEIERLDFQIRMVDLEARIVGMGKAFLQLALMMDSPAANAAQFRRQLQDAEHRSSQQAASKASVPRATGHP